MKNFRELDKKLNLGFVELLGQQPCEDNGVPVLGFDYIPTIDYVALFSDLSEYKKTKNTCVAFYQYDEVFDGRDGLFLAIGRQDKVLLSRYRRRFEDVRYIITPDYTVSEDLPDEWNSFARLKARIVSRWLKENTKAEIIPNVSYTGPKSVENCFRGIRYGSFVAYSAKGNLGTNDGKLFVKETLKVTVDLLRPIGILVFTTSPYLNENSQIFDYAKGLGTKIVIPETRARERNRSVRHEEV